MKALGVVDKAGEHNDTEHKEKDEQRQLLGGRLECVHKDLQAWRVSRQFEQPQYANDGEELENVRVVDVVRQLLQLKRQSTLLL